MKKIILLCSLTAGIYLFPAAVAYAENIQVEVLSAEKWIDTYGNEAVKNTQRDVLKGAKIYCGSQDKDACDVNTETCLKCTYRKRTKRSFGLSRHSIEYTIGACVSKKSYEEALKKPDGPLHLFREKNPECPSQEDEDKGWEGSGWFGKNTLTGYLASRDRVYKGNVVEEPKGFIGSKVDDASRTLGSDEVKETWSAFQGSDGKSYYMAKIGGAITIIMADNESAFNGCEVLPVKIYNMSTCFFCPLANLIFSMANNVTAQAFRYFSHDFRVLIGIVFAIWLALAALGQVFPMTKQDAPKFLAAILKQSFKFMVAFFLLYYGNDLFRYFIVPLLDSGLKMGIGIQTVSLPTPDNFGAKPPVTDANYYNLPGNNGQTLYERIEEYLASLQARLAYVQAIGTTVYCVGSHQISFWNLVTSLSVFKAGLRMMFLGGVLTSFSFLLTMAFAFYFMDAILQLAIIGAMIPFMIAGWPFKATAQYASTGFKMLLNTFFAMFFTGFVISVNVELINQSLALSQGQTEQQEDTSKSPEKKEESAELNEENKEVKNDFEKIVNGINERKWDYENKSVEKKEESVDLNKLNKDVKNGFERIASAINDQNWDALNKATDIGGTGFLLLAFCCIFGFKFVAQVTPLASKLSAGGFSKGGIAGKIGTMGASFAKGMATKAAAPFAKAAGNAAWGAVGTVAQTGAATVGGLAGGTAKLLGRGLSATGNAVSKHGGIVGKAAGGALKGAGWVANKTGSAVNSVSRGAGKIAKSAADGMKKEKE